MTSITLRDLLISARSESVLMRHNYLGVEHLLIALLNIPNGLTSTLLQEQGLAPLYARDAIRRKVGKGTDQRLWVGFRYTPRANVVLDIARDLAADQALPEPSERELLTALLIEGDSLPLRLLKQLGVDLDRLRQEATTRKLTGYTQPPEVAISFGPDFSPDFVIERKYLFILRRMFAGYPAIRIERHIVTFSKTLVLVVTPIQLDGRDLAPVIAKIGLADAILDEVQRYEAHVKSSLPLRTARLEDPPTAPDNSELAGIKYTLVASTGTAPQDLRSYVQTQGLAGLDQLLRHELFERFRKNWWQQSRPFRFQVWAEYDWLLPPILTLEMTTLDDHPDAHVIRIPFNRARLKTRLQQLHPGDMVRLENFTAYKVDPAAKTLKLSLGYGAEADKRAYRIEVHGLSSSEAFYRGEIIDRVTGRILKTRQQILTEAVRQLEPDFDPLDQWIPAGHRAVLNPVRVYEDLLDLHVNGSLSRIHGDLHLGNILVGPDGGVWLIDFADTRDGHTLFDWATFEISLLGDAIMPQLGDDWHTVRQVFQMLSSTDQLGKPHQTDSRFQQPYEVLRTLRAIVGECLALPVDWSEYYIALSLCGLRAITFNTMGLGGRRLAFLLAGMAAESILSSDHMASSTDTPSPDETADDIPAFPSDLPAEAPPAVPPDTVPYGAASSLQNLQHETDWLHLNSDPESANPPSRHQALHDPPSEQ